MTFASMISAQAGQVLRDRSCVVLGGGGFLGIHLCNALAEAGAKVRAFGRTRSFPEALDPRIAWIEGDFHDVTALRQAIEGQRSVFHLVTASVPESSNRDPLNDLDSNVGGTLRLLDLIRSSPVETVVFTSSGGTVYGIPTEIPVTETAQTDPISAYGIGKLAIEKYMALYADLYGLKSRILRISNPYGRYQSFRRKQGVVGAMMRRALSGQPLEIWGDGTVTRDFVHVADVVSALLEVHAYEGRHRVFNVGSQVGLSVNDIAASVERVFQRGPLERVHLGGRAADVPVNILSTDRIRAETGWSPRVPWDIGLADTLAWMRIEMESSASR